MEKTKANKNPQRFLVNLKTLPPLDPSTIPPPCQDKYENPTGPRNELNVARTSSKTRTKVDEFVEVPRKAERVNEKLGQKMEDREGFCSSSTKSIDPNSTKDFDCNKENEIFRRKFGFKEAPKKASAKSQLHETCAANKWKYPLYDCCKEEGPPHMKLYTFKVVVEIREASSTTILECFSDPKPTKKMAADNAAEGALWYLRHIRYFPPNKLS